MEAANARLWRHCAPPPLWLIYTLVKMFVPSPEVLEPSTADAIYTLVEALVPSIADAIYTLVEVPVSSTAMKMWRPHLGQPPLLLTRGDPRANHHCLSHIALVSLADTPCGPDTHIRAEVDQKE